MPYIPNKISLAILAAIIVPCFGRLALHGSGVEHQLFRYLVPFGIGGLSGFCIGYLLDKRIKTLHQLRETNSRLKDEIKERHNQEVLHSTLFEKNHTIILLVDPETLKIVDANPRACKFYGYSLEQFKEMRIPQLNTLSEKEIAKEANSAKKERRKQYYFKHRLASGEERDVEVSTGPIIIDGKTLLLSMVSDITELKLLRGIIPICSSCKQIRDGEGYWSQVEAYIQRHSAASFSHSVCPSCVAKLYPELIEKE